MGFKAYTTKTLPETGVFRTPDTALRAIQRGAIRAHRVGRQWVVLEDELIEDLRALRMNKGRTDSQDEPAQPPEG